MLMVKITLVTECREIKNSLLRLRQVCLQLIAFSLWYLFVPST